MSQRELTRLEVIQRVKRKTLKQQQAAELLSVSVRQVKRLCKAYQGNGAAGLISKRRGQPSNNRLPEKTINKARRLLRSRYPDFGPTLATEKLAIEGVSLSVETVRQLLMGEGLWKAKAIRRPVIHQLREAAPVSESWSRSTAHHMIGLKGGHPSARCWCSSTMLLRA
jgi:transposase